jgi:hypothetical protein
MNIFLSRNDALRLPTLKACFVIGKHRKPFSDGDFIKSLVLAVQPKTDFFVICLLAMTLSNEEFKNYVSS